MKIAATRGHAAGSSSTMRATRECPEPGHRLDAVGATFLATAIVALLSISTALAAQATPAGSKARVSASTPTTTLDKKFKGKLPITELTEDEAIVHALNRLAYGPGPGDVERVRQMGLEKWIDQQLHPESIDDSALDKRLENYPTLRMSSAELEDQFPAPQQAAKKDGETKEQYQQQMMEKRSDARDAVMQTGNDNLDRGQMQLANIQGPNRIVAELSMAKMDRAVYSQRQLEAVMEDFWFNHFNVFAGKGVERWLLTPYVRDTIRPHTMGKFDDLLVATAQSPAMLFYLDNWLSADPTAFQRMQAERAMRRSRFWGMDGEGNPPEVQNGAAPKRQERGLNENYGREVMELHTVGVDAGYTQQDVIEMAECLTGWTIREPRKDPEFFFNDRIHADGKKVVMGHTFDSGGMKDGEEALKMLAGDPHTARFISTEIARHFVSDNPPPSLVNRMAKDYESSGGDITSLLRTMIYSPEFWSRDAYRAKIKTPFELVASTARALNAQVSISLPLVQWTGRMGEPLFQAQPPTGYSDKAETWVNTGALLNRLNFALAFSTDRMAGATVDLSTMFGDDASKDPQTALARALTAFLDDQVAPATRDTLENRLNDPQILQARLDDPVEHVNEGLISGLVLGAPEFQRR
jgi:uncharacterized protein (DUF1800 family)